jgi:hypothetical protein
MRANPPPIVLALVLEKVWTLTRPVYSRSPEGSRFGVHPATLATFVSSLVRPKRAKAGGSRERPIAFAALWSFCERGRARAQARFLIVADQLPVTNHFPPRSSHH